MIGNYAERGGVGDMRTEKPGGAVCLYTSKSAIARPENPSGRAAKVDGPLHRLMPDPGRSPGTSMLEEDHSALDHGRQTLGEWASISASP